MSSVLPTVLDQHDLNKACVERLKLVALWRGYKKLPQIFSHGNIIVKPADPVEDFIFEPEFADHAILVSAEMTGTFCEQASCNAHVRGGGDCTYKADKPSLFISHDTTYSQCEPACWLFGDDVVRTDLTSPDSMYLMWDGQNCQFGNQGLFSYFTDPVIRSKARWEINVNTVPTGFDTVVGADGKLRATLNDEYCSQFNRHLSDDGRSCVRAWWQVMLDYLPIGTTICELTESAIRNNWNETPAEYDKDPDPSSVHPGRVDADEWRKRIDPNFTPVKPNIRLSDLGFTPEMLHPTVRRAFYYHNKENSILRTFNLYKSVEDARVPERRGFFAKLEQPLPEKRERLPSRAYLTRVHKVKLEWLRRSGEYKNRRELIQSLHTSLDMVGEDSDDDDVVNPAPQDYIDQLNDACLHLFANLPELLKTICSDWQGMTEMASQALILSVMKQVKGVLLKLIEGTLTKTITTMFERFSSRMFVHVMSSLINTAITRLTSGLVGKIMILAAKLLVAVVDWAEILQVVVAVVDIVWSILDPFGKNKYIGQDDLDNVTESFYDGLKKLGCSTYITDPLLYYNIVLAQANNFGVDNYFAADTDESTPKLADDGNPLEYDEDENIFYLYMAAHYYKTRSANSLGEPFEWESDIVDFSGVDVGTNIYQSMLSNSDAIAQFNNYNYMQVGVMGLLVVVLVLFLLFVLTGLAIVGVLAGAAVYSFIFLKFCVDRDTQTVVYKSIRQSLGVVDDLPENC